MKSLSHVRLFAAPWAVACTRLFRPWDFLGKSTGVGCHFLLQGIFPTQGSNPGLPHCRQTLYHLSHQGSLSINSFCTETLSIRPPQSSLKRHLVGSLLLLNVLHASFRTILCFLCIFYKYRYISELLCIHFQTTTIK